MTNKQIDNRVKKLQSITDQIKALEDQAAALKAEITGEIESRDGRRRPSMILSLICPTSSGRR